MFDHEPAGVQRDAARKRQAGSVPPIADDRAATPRELLPQLVPPPRRRGEFHERHLPGPPHDAGPDVGRTGGGGRSSRLVFRVPLQRIVPVDPLIQRRRKPPLDDGHVVFRDGPVAKLGGERRGRCPRRREHEHAGHGRVEPADHAEERTAPTPRLQD